MTRASLHVALPAGYAAERAYVVSVLFEEFLGLDVAIEDAGGAGTEVRLAGGDRRLVLRDGLFGTPADRWLTDASLPRSPFARLELAGTPFAAHPSRDVVALYGSPTWREDSDGLELGVDLLGGSFFLLTRYEEIVVEGRDDHGRFPSNANVVVREGLGRRPLVNEYVELLWLALRRLWPGLERKQRRFVVAPSHDVDWPFASEQTAIEAVRRAGADVVRAHDVSTAIRRMRGFVRRQHGDRDADVNNTFDSIMSASERKGLRSAFYFIAGRRTATIDGDYSLDDPWIRALLRRVHDRGHEIGFHASYTTPVDVNQTIHEWSALRRVCEAEGIEQDTWGGRQHFLRWSNPETWRNWEAAGLAYDATVGFAEEVGFRAGVCFEYPVFDLLARRRLALREQPLVAMEVAALGTPARNFEDAATALLEVREACRRYRGTFTLLWHNSRLVHARERQLYEEILG